MAKSKTKTGSPFAGRWHIASMTVHLAIFAAFNREEEHLYEFQFGQGPRFDFGDNWQHQINVEANVETVPHYQYPKVIKRVGESPPQYTEEDE